MTKDAHATLEAYLIKNHPQIELEILGNEGDTYTQQTWGRGDKYVIY